MLTGTTIMIGIAVAAVIIIAFIVMKGSKYEENLHTAQSNEKQMSDKPVAKKGESTSINKASKKKTDTESAYSSPARRDKPDEVYPNLLHPANPLNPLYMDVGEDTYSRSSRKEGTHPSSSFDEDTRPSYSSGSSSYDSGSSSSGSDSSSW